MTVGFVSSNWCLGHLSHLDFVSSSASDQRTLNANENMTFPFKNAYQTKSNLINSLKVSAKCHLQNWCNERSENEDR